MNNFMSFGVFIITLIIGASFAMRGEIGISKLIAIVQLTNYTAIPLASFSRWVASGATVRASYERITDIHNLKNENALKPLKIEEKPNKILIDELSFAYAENAPVIENANAVFEKGKVIGVIGKSGGGKSTLIQLILGLYQPNSGSIGLETSCGETTPPPLGSISYVPSDKFIFSGTIKENICMASAYDETKMKTALHDANLNDYIQSLPDGIESRIEDSGQNLSMGQAQRIAIARALYADSGVILMDEPTSNLDANSISVFYDTVRKKAADKIIIIVTHDRSAIDICDIRYELSNRKLLKV